VNPGRPLVIVGASYAGLQAAASARELGFQERIYLIGEEPHAPYQRPALSKGLLTRQVREDQLPLRSPGFFADQDIDLLTRTRVTSIDPAARRAVLDKSIPLDYGWLVMATGASPRALRIPGADLERAFQLRTVDDALAIAKAADTAQQVCVLGGGYIGLEVAAALTARGKKVTVLESQARVLARSMPECMSAYLEAAHRRRGVDLRTSQRVRALAPCQGRVAGVELADGTRVDCEMVVLGIGAAPNAGVAQAAGLAVSNGIEVDLQARTSAPNVLAAGDVACMPSPTAADGSGRVRLESIQAAIDGAKAAAATLVGRNQPVSAVPWFWSDQFDLKLQMVGMPQPGDEVVVRGDMATDRFSVAYLRRGTLVALHSVNRPAEHMLARKLIANQVRPCVAILADSSLDLRVAC